VVPFEASPTISLLFLIRSPDSIAIVFSAGSFVSLPEGVCDFDKG
jgi:hypothetical protein